MRLPSSCGETLQEPPAVLGAVASRPACRTCSGPAARSPWLPHSQRPSWAGSWGATVEAFRAPCRLPPACWAPCEQASPPWGKLLARLAVLP